MIARFELFPPGHIAAEDLGQDLLACLDETLGPACLLGLESRHLNGQLRRTLNVLEIFEFPAFELGAIRKIGVFGQRVMLPALGVFYRFAPPHAGSSIEVEEHAAARTSAVFQD